jgi:uncharacterized protein (DUF1810 family)
MMSDPFDLQRFVDAQDRVFDTVLAELQAGRKRTHWMWYIFPQIRGLGRSSTAQKFAISSLAEAIAYLDHPILGPRLRECIRLLNAIDGHSAEEIFGYPDHLKFHSSVTLFARVNPGDLAFKTALDKFYEGEGDPLTLEQLS